MNCRRNQGDVCRSSREQTPKFTIERAAEKLGVDSRTLRRYEAGETEVPEDILIAMSKIYGDPLLPWNYWTRSSLIAKHYGMKPFEENNVYAAALSAADDLNQLSQRRERFIEIMKDACVIENEHNDFREIDATAADCAKKMIYLRFVAAKKEKTATAMAV
ncbi:helix-turn-helix protein [Hydrogenispora ethanolica]|uniref:Helix-turn-helix protein n=1 Tax=Hydrogenispora ethanolica TaxID=1082276 RepID=A0A4R1S6V8_HYDET|nr:helix-turn-helix transcriptional regulator [Hydrogenispora ethanolica]TCL74192.1 helix-turn-helix protein [Hydrogenispora ethanolica]